MYSQAQDHYKKILESIQADGLYKEERLICSAQGAEIQVKFPADSPEKQLVNLCANNYLGLSSHPQIIQAAHQGLDQRGFGMSSVRFICGTQDIHRQLEQKISDFLFMQDSILFSSCFDANAALFETLLGAEDAIFSDKLVHASIIDGMRLSKAPRHIFEHSNMEQLEDLLRNSQARIKLIMTDGVFSMDGDMAKLNEICDLAEKYQALVAVDDSHATGFIGKTGRGTHEHFQVIDRVDLITTTFGKALGGAAGGCIAGKKEIIALLKQRARPYLFSNALPPPVVTATLAALEILSASTERRDKLERLSTKWRKGLTEAGFDIKPGNTPIVPVMLYDANLAQQFSRELYSEGLFAVGFFYPVVPKGQARIRTQISAALDDHHLNKALSGFVKVAKKLGVRLMNLAFVLLLTQLLIPLLASAKQTTAKSSSTAPSSSSSSRSSPSTSSPSSASSPSSPALYENVFVQLKDPSTYREVHQQLGTELIFHSSHLNIDFVRGRAPVCDLYKNLAVFCELAPSEVDPAEASESRISTDAADTTNLPNSPSLPDVSCTKPCPLVSASTTSFIFDLGKHVKCDPVAKLPGSRGLIWPGLSPLWAQELTGADLAKELVLSQKGQEVKFGLFEDVDLKALPPSMLVQDVKKCLKLPNDPGCPDVSPEANKERRWDHGTSVTALVADPVVGTGATAKLAVSAIFPDKRSLIDLNFGASFLPTIGQMMDRKVNLLCSSVVLSKHETFDKAYKDLQDRGVIVVQGSGNSHPEESRQGIQKGTIMVGAIGPEGLTSGFSQESEHLTILAPVENQLQTKTNGKFKTFDGTSAAQPQVCGAVANVLALLPGLTEAEASKLIKETAIPSLNSQQKPQRNGAGTLNAYKMAAVAARLKEGWRGNRDRIFKDPTIYEFSESQKLFDDAKKKLDANNLKTGSNPCAATRDGLIMLRKAALLSPNDKTIRDELAKTYRALGFARNARFYESMNGVTLADLEKLWKEFSTTKHEAMTIAREAERRGQEAVPLLQKILEESTASDVIKVAANSVQKIAGRDKAVDLLLATISKQKSLAPALKSIQLARDLGTPTDKLKVAISKSSFKQQLLKAAEGE